MFDTQEIYLSRLEQYKRDTPPCPQCGSELTALKVIISELEKSQLDYIREPGETQSACIRRLVNEKWCDQNMAFDAEQDSSEWDHCEARW